MALEEEGSTGDSTAATYVRRHVAFGWCSMLAFLVLGIVLESMHGFKVGWYLDAGEETRRLLLTLAHAHGVLLGLVNLALAATIRLMPHIDPLAWRLASPCLLAASFLMPTGFLLGGLVTYAGDPGVGIFLLPPAGLLLLIAVSSIAWTTLQSRA